MLCGKFPFDEEILSVLFNKIMMMDFEIPDFVSVEVSNLIRKILQASPLKRATIDDIKMDAWFLVDWKESTQLDSFVEDIFIEAHSKFKELMSYEDALRSIESGETNDIVVVYNLLLSHKKFE
jgi:serine/threonine protein kinase